MSQILSFEPFVSTARVLQ